MNHIYYRNIYLYPWRRIKKREIFQDNNLNK